MTRTAPTARSAPRLAFACAALLLVAACEQPAGSGAAAPDAMVLVSGNDQVASVGEDLPEAVTVRVVDRRGRPVAGQPVQFAVLSGGGSVVAEAANTDADGRVAARWKLGTAAGEQALQARITDGSGGVLLSVEARARARAGPPAAITAVGRTDLGTDTLFADSLAVRVADAWANPAPGVEVHWSTTGGALSPAASITDSAGIATAYWTLPGHAGEPSQADHERHTISATAGGVAAAFQATLQLLPLKFLVTAPTEGAVLRTRDLRITAVCARCERFRIGGVYDGPGVAFDSVVRIAPGGAELRFEVNGFTALIRHVYVQESPAWKAILTAGSQVRDYEPGRLLFTLDSLNGSYLASYSRLRERSLETGAERELVDANLLYYARFTPRGAFTSYYISYGFLFRTFEGEVSSTPFDLHGGRVYALTRRWLLWSDGSLWRRDFDDGSNLRISSGSGDEGDVADNGDVVYGGSGRIFRYRNGATDELGSGRAPLTDGTNVVWRTSEDAGTYGLVANDGSGEHVLASGLASPPVYAVENGWIVYSAPDAGGQLRLWRRAPGGATAAVAALSSSWKLVTLGPNGAAVIEDDGRWYVVRPDGSHSDIGVASQAWVKWIGDRLIAGLGNTVFEVSY